MNKDELMKFFDLNNDIEYYILNNYYCELAFDRTLSCSKIAKELQISRQNLNVIIKNLRVKSKLGHKIQFYTIYMNNIEDEFKDYVNVLYFYEHYIMYLFGNHKILDYHNEDIMWLNINKKTYSVLKNKYNVNTLSQFIIFMLNNYNKKIEGLGATNKDNLIKCFSQLIRAKFGSKKAN